MSEFIVTNKEYLTIMIDHPNTIEGGVFRNPAWSGSLECKKDNYTLDQIASLAGKADYVFKVFKVTEHGEVVNLTDTVLNWMEGAGE